MPTPIGANWGAIWQDGVWAAGVWTADPPDPPSGSVLITADDATVTIYKGSNVIITVTLTRDEITGDVTLAVEDLPTGVTASYLTDDTFTGAETTKQIRLSAASDADDASDDAFTITASASGADDSVVNGTVTVTDAPTPDTGTGSQRRRRAAVLAVLRFLRGR